MEQTKCKTPYVNELGDEVCKTMISNTIGVFNHNNKCKRQSVMPHNPAMIKLVMHQYIHV